MRGVLYRTDSEGNTLETPELKISAIRGNNIKVYANQDAKQAALEAGDIKPGDVVLSGGEQYGSGCNPIWDEAITVSFTNKIIDYTCPADGFIILDGYGTTNDKISINDIPLFFTNGANSRVSTSMIVNAGDKISSGNNVMSSTGFNLVFVPRR